MSKPGNNVCLFTLVFVDFDNNRTRKSPNLYSSNLISINKLVIYFSPQLQQENKIRRVNNHMSQEINYFDKQTKKSTSILYALHWKNDGDLDRWSLM